MATKALDVFTLKNRNGVEISFTAHGGRIISIKTPSSTGEIADIVIGYDTSEESLTGDLYFGAIVGRYANRVAYGKFSIEGESFQLDVNNGPNHLHGGFEGFHTRIWNVKKTERPGATNAWELSLTSPDNDQNYPGELHVKVVYSLTPDNHFIIEYEAETSKATIINLTSHPYFNLRGAGNGDVLDHELQLMADDYTPIDENLGTCAGEIAPVDGSPFDFTKPKRIREAVKSDFSQARLVDGIDHNFIVNKSDLTIPLAAILKDLVSGRKLEVYTDQPGIQVYTANHFDGSQKGKKGNPIVKHAGVALETQIFPNSPNVSHFPNAVLKPGEKYTHTCVYRFLS
jgi:aldose 1-epimerase